MCNGKINDMNMTQRYQWQPELHTVDSVARDVAALCTKLQAGIETYLIERKLDNCKPCGGAIPLCMIDEFDLPRDIVDRQARVLQLTLSFH